MIEGDDQRLGRGMQGFPRETARLHTAAQAVTVIMGLSSFASIVDQCDNFRRGNTSEHFSEFRLTSDSKHVIGLITDDVLDALRAANRSSLTASVWDIQENAGRYNGSVAHIVR